MPFTKIHQLLALVSVVVIATQVQAQQGDNGAEEVVVTSSRIPIPQRKIGTSVSIMEEKEIEARGNLTFVDVIRQMPAIGTTNNGGPGKVTLLRVRGEEGFRTLTILDGIRMSDPSAPQIATSMEHLLSSGIGRVEILRGPQGLSYGADAGGVVNISSIQAEKGMRGNLDFQTGANKTFQKTANIGGAGESGDVFLAVSDFETDGFNNRTDDIVLMDNDDYENTTIHFRTGLKLSDKLRLGLVYRDVDGESQYDGCGFPTMYDCQSIYDQQAARVSLDYSGDNFTHSLSYAETETSRDDLTEGLSAFSSKGELKRFEYTGAATSLPGFDLVYGFDKEEAVNGDTGRDNEAVYLEFLSDFSDHVFFTAGVRHDDNDDFGSNDSYRISGAYLVDLADGSTLKFRSSYGTGFRAPSPYEIEYNKGAFAYPPASLVTLQQETSEGYEFGVEYFGANSMKLEAVYFDQDVEDSIDFDLAAFSGYLQDFGKSTSKGVELIGEVSLSDSFTLTANYTYNDAELPDGTRRLRRPKHLINLGASWYGLQDRLNIHAFLRVSRYSIDIGGPLENFEVLDLTTRYSLTDRFQIYGRIENLLDEEYQEVLAYNTPERGAYIGMKFGFAGL